MCLQNNVILTDAVLPASFKSYSETTLKIGKMWGCFENPIANDTIYSGDASFLRLLLFIEKSGRKITKVETRIQ